MAKGKKLDRDAGLTADDMLDLEIISDNTEYIVDEIGTALVRALEAVGIQAESDAAKLCPVDTGRLRNSITHTIDEGGKWAIVGTNVEYAQYVHNGTSTHKAQPFLTDAVNQNADKYRKIIEAGLKNG